VDEGSHEFTFELANQRPDAIAEELKCINDRFRLENPRLAERYMENLIGFHVHFQLAPGRPAETYCAALHRSVENLECSSIKFEPHSGESNDRIQEAVFVLNVQLMDIPQSFVTIPTTRSRVRLRFVDHCFGEWANAMYFSHTLGFVFLPVPVNRKFGQRMERGRIATIPQDQLPDQQIQTGAEMIENFAGEYAEAMQIRRGIDIGSPMR
jgi:hypothetical protein